MTNEDEYFHIRRWIAWGWLLVVAAVIAWFIPDSQQKARDAQRAKQVSMVLRQIEQAIVLVDDKMRIELFSQSAERMFGVKEEDVTGAMVLWMIPSSDRRMHSSAVQRFWENPNDVPKVITCQALTFGGEPFDVRMTLRGCRMDSNGEWKLVAIIERAENINATITLPSPKPAIGNSPNAIGPGGYRRE